MKDAKQLYHGYRFHPTIISHAVWLGLCQKVKDGSISQSRAASIFEQVRDRIKRAEEKRVRVVVKPFG